MRILLAHNRYRFLGGEERHVELLAEWLPEVGVQVARLDPSSASVRDGIAGEIALGLQLPYRPAGGRLVADALRGRKADVVHFHNITPLLTPAALRAARRSGAKVVLTLSNFRFACPAGTLLRDGVEHDDCITGSSLACGLRNSRGRWRESISYGLAIEIQRRLGLLTRWVDAFVAPSDFLATRAILSGLPAERIHVIPNGTPVPTARQPGGDGALYVGRLSTEKGIDVLLDAAQVHSVSVDIAGDGPLRDSVARANGRVSYHGQLDQPALAQLRDRAACAVVPSVGPDVLPFSAIESLAAGLPVVASRVGGLPEIVDDGVTGFLVPPGDPAALAAAVRRLTDDQALAERMAAAARVAALERFDAERQARKMADLYRSLL